MARKCVRFKRTSGGKRCAKFSGVTKPRTGGRRGKPRRRPAGMGNLGRTCTKYGRNKNGKRVCRKYSR